MTTTRLMPKSPLAIVRAALATARDALPAYSSKFSRRDYTLHQLFALLALREFLKTDYRGLEQMLQEWAVLREVLRLDEVPDHSTLQRAAARVSEKKGAPPCSIGPSPRRGYAA